MFIVKAAVRNFRWLKLIQNQYLSKYITSQCSKLSTYPIHNGKLIIMFSNLSGTGRFSWEIRDSLNMSLAKVVLFTLSITQVLYSSICSQYIKMFSQLFKLNHLNKQFYLEQYCPSSQHAMQLENI